MKSRLLSIAVALIVAPTIALVAQRPTQVVLGSMLPANSVWDKALKQMAAEWEKETDGRVKLRVRPGSVKNEGELLRLLRIANRPSAGVFALPGEIDDAFATALVTGKALFSFDAGRARFRLESVHPGHTMDEVGAATGFDFDRAADVGESQPPDAASLALIRGPVGQDIAETYPRFAAEALG